MYYAKIKLARNNQKSWKLVLKELSSDVTPLKNGTKVRQFSVPCEACIRRHDSSATDGIAFFKVYYELIQQKSCTVNAQLRHKACSLYFPYKTAMNSFNLQYINNKKNKLTFNRSTIRSTSVRSNIAHAQLRDISDTEYIKNF